MGAYGNALIRRLWNLKEFEPNSGQEEAILYDGDNPLFITAAPGSGKTRVLLWRAVNLIVCHGVAPEEIYLGTFTEKAAFQLREGLKSLLGLASNETNRQYDLSRMYLGTIHSNCHRILSDRGFSRDKHRVRPPVLLDESGQYFHVYRKRFWEEMATAAGFTDHEGAIEEITGYFGWKRKSRHHSALNCITFFNRLSEEVVDPRGRKTTDDTLQKLLKMYEHYLDSLRRPAAKRTDLSLLQQEALEVIEGSKGSGKAFRHIIVDEYQDTNAVQEKIFFGLAGMGGNLCVVGDDDQALYRFRGATVENFVDFEERCLRHLRVAPKKVNLNVNYRSREEIVRFYSEFIRQIDWSKDGRKKTYYRITDKRLEPHRKTKDPAIVVTEQGNVETVVKGVVDFVVKLKKTGKIKDYKQVAFLFPYLKGNPRVKDLKEEFQKRDIRVYAPRAGRFLDVEESLAVFGLFLSVFGRPGFTKDVTGRDAGEFVDWLEKCEDFASDIIAKDKDLKRFIEDKVSEIKTVIADYDTLLACAQRNRFDLDAPFKMEMRRVFSSITVLSDKARRSITSKYFEQRLLSRQKEGKPLNVRYVINRATALDWNLLDLFYQLNGFRHFMAMHELAERGEDEGPICNLGLITQYLSNYMDQYGHLIVAETLKTGILVNTFFMSYCFSLFRLQESEFEYADDPFPKGRVPFLTIHQSKGLEFPVVVLGSLYRQHKDAPKIEVLIRDLLKKEGEPLDRITLFDNMRLFYVALSRAANLLVIPRIKRQGVKVMEEFKPLLEKPFCTVERLDFKGLPTAELKEEDLGKSYSYTGDYLMYKKCARNYMFFRKYGFVPSKSQTMFFGTLVHRTIEDLHNFIISTRLGKTP